MKKCISILIFIFIFIAQTSYILAYDNGNLADYNELYGIREEISPQIVLKSKNRSAIQQLKYLAVFIEFSDSDTAVANHLDDPQSVANAEKIFNSDVLFDMDTVNGIIKVPSFKKYYEMQSYGKLSITTEIFPKSNGTVVSYRDSHPMAYYLKYSETNPDGYKNSNESLQRETELINNAVNYVSNQIAATGITANEIDSGNDNIVDAISFFIEGNDVLSTNIAWGDLLWSHKMDNLGVTATILGKNVYAYNLIYTYDYTETAGVFSLNRGTYGTIIHEFGHTLGYMDLYRFEGSNSMPVGFYDIMGKTIGSNPQDLLTYFISEYTAETSWHKPLPVVDKTTQNITLYKPEYIDDNEKRAIKVKADENSEEYFIIEYHEKKNTYSSYSADESGIIIYRVNEKNKFQGNKEGGTNGENDHIFVFRPNETGLGDANGDLSKATLNKNRTHLGKGIKEGNDGFDNQTIYYSDGSNSGIIIDVVGQTDNSVTFNVTFPEMQGSGTQSDPYLISDTESYLYLLQRNTENKYYKLVNDIDFSSVADYPKIDFKGHLDGNNKTISNLTTIGTGLFNNVGEYGINSSSVENLNIENINCTGKGNYLGGLAGVATNCTLKNIHLKSGNITNIITFNDLSSTGGFIGNAYNSVTIENCSSSVNINAEKNIGGFIGMNSNAIIKNSYSDGQVSGQANIGGFIGIQCISDITYNIPENAYYDYSKIQNAVGGYASYLHDLTVLPESLLGKGIVGISTVKELNINKGETVEYRIITNPNSNLQLPINVSDNTIIQYSNQQVIGLKSGTAIIYVDLTIGTRIIRLKSKVIVNETSLPDIEIPKIISEIEVLNYFGLTKRDGYVSGFNLGSDVANIRVILSSYPNVTLSSFRNASGGEISSGIVSTNMKFTLIFNQTEYHYTIVVKGDSNGDGKIEARDYVCIKNHIMGITPMEGAYLIAADVNNNYEAQATDYMQIKNYIMGVGVIEQKL